jgi:hypothetical protein
MWMQSAIADASARALLFDLDQSIQSLSVGRAKDDPDVDRLIHVYHNLLRRWAQPDPGGSPAALLWLLLACRRADAGGPGLWHAICPWTCCTQAANWRCG